MLCFPVSYTHLDVYKRQPYNQDMFFNLLVESALVNLFIILFLIIIMKKTRKFILKMLPSVLGELLSMTIGSLQTILGTFVIEDYLNKIIIVTVF